MAHQGGYYPGDDAQHHFYPQHTPQASMESIHAPYASQDNMIHGQSGAPYDGSHPAPRADPRAGMLYTYSEKPTGAHAIHARTQKRKNMMLLIIGIVIVVIIAIVLLVVFCVVKPQQEGSSAGKPQSEASSTVPQPKVLIGKDGDNVTMEDGKVFTYRNKFGGFFVDDSSNPYNDAAQAQSYTPPLNQSWKFGQDRIMGVNLGGWLVPEPFIVPALYERYMEQPEVNGDEWSLSAAMARDTANGGLTQLENHYKTFITEEDFAQIAAAGLNWIRLPIPFNAFGTLEGEPFLPHVAWNYTLKAFAWARKYGLRINLDIHTMPGSQNGLNHSGKKGYVAFASSVMGLANAQRGLDIIRSVTQFISQPEYKMLVPIFSIINEPQGQDQQVMHAFYLEAYNMIRNITGTGEGNGPYIAIHDHFEPLSNWANFLHGADRLALDTHPYFTFGGQDSPSIEGFPPRPCSTWGTPMNASRNTLGVTFAGEWSLGFNDCGQHIWGLNEKPKTTNCDAAWNDYTKWTPETKAQLLSLAKSHMSALQDYFFWTWKTGVSSLSPQGGTLVGAPLWNYKLGLELGIIPDDPRSADGECVRLGVVPQPDQLFNGFQSWQTGGVGAGQIAPTATAGIDVWPPAALATIEALPVPQYTPTGPVPTLPLPTLPAAAVPTADGWFNEHDQAGGMVPIAGCTYPDPWNPGNVPPTLCSGAPGAEPAKETVLVYSAPIPVRRRSWQTPAP